MDRRAGIEEFAPMRSGRKGFERLLHSSNHVIVVPGQPREVKTNRCALIVRAHPHLVCRYCADLGNHQAVREVGRDATKRIKRRVTILSVDKKFGLDFVA